MRGLSVFCPAWIGFAVFCLLASAEWLIPPPSASDALPALERQGLLYGAVGVGAFLLAVTRRGTVRRDKVRWGWLSVGGVGFFGIPALFSEMAAGHLSGMIEAAGFAAAPVLVVMIVAFTDGHDGERRLLAPALAGLGGILLLLPFALPGSVRGRVMLGGLIAVVALIAVLSVWLNEWMQGVELEEAAAVFGLANAVFLLIFSFGNHSTWRWHALVSLISLQSLFEAAELILMVWLLRDLPPVRFAARYLVIPLLTVAEGFAVFRPGLTVRMESGMALLAIGASIILFSRNKDSQRSLSLR